ncbi:MAG TPA: glycosyltransferase family 9 protein [Desulfuromonas sp.]|nr:glycosyltransferase family 9 protein [Desulfuromonas sp.]
MRRAFPAAEIDLNTLPPWDKLFFAEDPRFARIVTIDLRGKDGGWRGVWTWLRTINRRRYDLLVDLQGNDRSRLLVTLLTLFGRRIPFRIGTQHRFPYNIAPQLGEGEVLSAFAVNQRALQAGGIATLTPRPCLHVPARNRRRGAELLAKHGAQPDHFAVFLPGCHAASKTKRWGAERYAELARLVLASGVRQIILVGGKDEKEECRQIEEFVHSEQVVNLCGETELLDLIEVFAQAKFLVGNDTGTAHLASCTDRKLLVICGPTDPRRVKPVGDNVETIQADLDCINCYRKECSHHSCMVQLTPELVFARVQAMLAR